MEEKATCAVSILLPVLQQFQNDKKEYSVMYSLITDPIMLHMGSPHCLAPRPPQQRISSWCPVKHHAYSSLPRPAAKEPSRSVMPFFPQTLYVITLRLTLRMVVPGIPMDHHTLSLVRMTLWNLPLSFLYLSSLLKYMSRLVLLDSSRIINKYKIPVSYCHINS